MKWQMPAIITIGMLFTVGGAWCFVSAMCCAFEPEAPTSSRIGMTCVAALFAWFSLNIGRDSVSLLRKYFLED